MLKMLRVCKRFIRNEVSSCGARRTTAFTATEGLKPYGTMGNKKKTKANTAEIDAGSNTNYDDLFRAIKGEYKEREYVFDDRRRLSIDG